MMEIRSAMAELKSYGKHITKQQYRTIKGQILSGDIDAAMRGLDRVLKRKGH